MIINEVLLYGWRRNRNTGGHWPKVWNLEQIIRTALFEWCQRIGVKHVYELLEAVYEDTHDERYKICGKLKKEYLKST